jgi:hypothetical protein
LIGPVQPRREAREQHLSRVARDCYDDQAQLVTL